MLLKQKKKEQSEANWSVILNPVLSDIDKQKVAKRISGAFGLSEEESRDLVNNTPIILLDNLAQNTAAKVKEYFTSTGGDFLLTNETHLKRKCYRTVWPESPNLESIVGPKQGDSSTSKDDTQRLKPEEALHEIRSLKMKHEKMVQESHQKTPQSSEPKTSGELLEEISRLKREKDDWFEKYEAQSREFEALLRQKKESLNGQFASLPKEREEQFGETKNRLARSEEELTHLREELEKMRSVYEEKLIDGRNEVQQWEQKQMGIAEESSQLRQTITELQAKVEELEGRNANLINEHNQLENQNLSVAETRAAHEQLTRDYEMLKSEVESNRSSLMKLLRDEQDKYLSLEREYQAVLTQMQEKDDYAKREKDSWKRRLEETTEKLETLEKSQMRFVDEVEARSKEAKEWELKSSAVEKNLHDLQQSHSSMEKMLQVNMKHLESREAELESTRRQLRTFTMQMEQRENAVKRAQVSDEITEREKRLHRLVTQQQSLESEIRERETMLSEILEEQESVEGQILERKQSQRHFLEQTKKENQSPRIQIHNKPEEQDS